MTTLNKALLGVLVVQIGLAVIFFTRGDAASIASLEPIIPGFDSKAIDRIEIFNAPATTEADSKDDAEKKDSPSDKDSKPAIVLARKDGSWVVASHFDYPADPARVNDVLDKIAGLAARGPLATSRARQTQLSVADDRYQRKVVLHRSGGEPVTLYVGDPAGSRQNAVRLAGHDETYGVASFSPYAVASTVTSWVSLEYFKTAEDSVASITITNAQGTFALERDGGQWQRAENAAPAPSPPAGAAPAAPARPAAAPGKPAGTIDSAAVTDIVKKMTDIRMAEPADPRRQLDRPLATVVLRMKPPPAPDSGDAGPPVVSMATEEHRFEIGPDENGRYYLRKAGESRAVTVHTGNLDPVVKLDEDTLYGQSKKEEAATAPPASPGGSPDSPPLMLPPSE